MYNYFKIPIYSLPYESIKFSDRSVIVIRNPIDRLVSAINGLTPWLHIYTPQTTWLDLAVLEGKSEDEVRELVIFNWHSKPYMSHFENENFRIIDFYKLNQYIPKNFPNLFQSPITNTSGLTNPKEHYIENSMFSLADLEEEYDLYLKIMSTKEQISVAEWKEKT
jgi:hypothetical protein